MLLAAVYVPTALALLAARLQPWVVPSSLVAPLRSGGREGWYEGLFSVVEVVLWAVAAASAGLAAARVRAGARARLLAGGAVVSVVLLLDDLFQLHKPVVPRELGVPSAVVLLSEAVLVAAFVISQRRAIGATPRPAVLAVSVAFFALWVAVKALPGFGGTTVIEAGAKFAGVVGWAAYWVGTALDGAHRSALPRRSDRATQSSIRISTGGEANATRQGGRHGRLHQRSPGGP